MPALDPFTVGVVSALFAVGLSVVLLISRMGLGPDAVGLRTWLVGDAALIASRYPTLSDLYPAVLPLPVDALVAATAFIAAGNGWHYMALRRHRAPAAKVSHGLAGGAAVGLLVALVGSWLDSAVDRARLFHGVMALLFMLQLQVSLPAARRLWGARMLSLAFCLAMAANAVLMATVSADKLAGHQWATTYLAMGTTMTLLTAMAFLLWLQQQAADRLARTACTDPLTGAMNRNGVLPRLQAELERARRTGRPLSVALCDLDHFKRVNDNHGHDVGDLVLQRFVAQSSAMLRKSDLMARWGGEEFLLVFPDTSRREAAIALERLRRAQGVPAEGLPTVTVSAGIATTESNDQGCQVAGLLKRADEQLYVAKRTRNTISVDSRDFALDPVAPAWT